MIQEVTIAGTWLCSCGLCFSWDSYHEKAVYTAINSKTGEEIKVEKPVCSGGNGPIRCPECGGCKIERINDSA